MYTDFSDIKEKSLLWCVFVFGLFGLVLCVFVFVWFLLVCWFFVFWLLCFASRAGDDM